MRRDLLTAPSRNTKASGLVAASVLLNSIFPVIVALSKTTSPFLFGCAWQTGVTLSVGAVVAVGYSDLARSRSTWRLVWQHSRSFAMAMWIAAAFQLAPFAWSTSMVDVAIVTVVYGAWPLGAMLLTAYLFKSEGRYRRPGPLTPLAFLIAIVGITLVTLSHAGDTDLTKAIRYLSDTPLALAGGVGLALGAAMLTAMASFGFIWAAKLAAAIPQKERHTATSLEMFSVLVGVLVGNQVAIPGLALIGFIRNEALVQGTLLPALAGGLLAGAGAVICWRWGMLIASDLKILVIVYFAPLLALAWLYSLSLVGDVDGKLLLGGAVVIAVANLIIFAKGRG